MATLPLQYSVKFLTVQQIIGFFIFKYLYIDSVYHMLITEHVDNVSDV